METVAPPGNSGWLVWWPIVAGLLALYGPTYNDMAQTLWNTEEQAHGPMVAAMSLWLIWQKRDAFLDAAGQGRPVLGGALLLVGLLLYVLGRSQSLIQLEVGSQIPVLGGIVLALRGGQATRALAFPVCFLVFSVPLPGVFIDAATGPLKQYVSALAEWMLYSAGYPVARNGVMLAIGQYQLLVADACSGLHSMFSLSAVGLLYVYLMAYRSVIHNALLLASMLPIAFFANVVRVLILVLVTYYFGDGEAQGFIHGFAGLLMFMIALGSLFALDSAMRWFIVARLKVSLR